MDTVKILEDLHAGRIDLESANSMIAGEDESPAQMKIEKKNLKRAHFIKISVRLPNESRRINWFMRCLFVFPVPVSLVNLFVRIAGKKMQHKLEDTGLDVKDLRTIIRYARGTRVRIEAEDARITVKIV